MTSTPVDLHRIHGFDALRAIMMMLGLVIHGSMTYSDVDYGAVWPLKDMMDTSHGFHVLIEFIHVFRMPAFFVIAGFFGALLFYKKSPRVMISNRLNRVVYPFIVALLILWPIAVFSFNFGNQLVAGSENGFVNAINAVFPAALVPQTTIHLWFLYYLAMISFLTCFMALGLKPINYCESRIKVWFEKAHENLVFILIPLTLVTFFSFVYMGSSSAITSSAFVPDLKTLFFYIIYFWYGWVLYLSKQLISVFIKPAWLMLVLGTIMFIIKMYFDMQTGSNYLYLAMFSNSLAIWLYIFAFMGLFMRYASSGSYILRYISDSAYWVYLIHLPLIAIVAGLISGFALPAVVKFLIVISSVTVICFVTYHYCVRNSFIGLFLNGRKYAN